jgi:hypothetical protein
LGRGFRAKGSALRAYDDDEGFRVEELGLRVRGLGLGLTV